MRDNDINLAENNTDETVKVRKKQKAAMGIRPSDYLEARFKEEAERKGLTQTKLFERVFWDYLNKASAEYRNQNLDCSLELQSVKGATLTLTKSIEQIISKSQDELARKNKEVESIKNATEKKIELATLELTNRIAELEDMNKKLEVKLNNSDAVIQGFDTIKEDLEHKNNVLRDALNNKDDEIETLKAEIRERDKAIKSLEKDIDNAIKSVANVEKEVALVKEEKNNLEARFTSAQANNQMLQDTLNNFNTMKAVEITAIKDNEANMSEVKLSSLETIKNAEIDKLNATIAILKESLALKTQENASLADTYNNIVDAKEKEIEIIFSKEKALLESTISKQNIEIEELKKALNSKEKAAKVKEKK